MTSYRSPLGRAESLSHQARVPIRDDGEPLVNFVGLSPRLLFAERHPAFDLPREHLVRRRVAAMLVEAAERLTDGLKLTIVEGWRAPAVQRQMYEATEREMRELHPDWSPAVLRRTINRFSAPPDHRVPPPHCTGGAVDLEITTPAGERLDMTSPYDLSDRRGNATDVRGLSPSAHTNRELLITTLSAVGFTNYPAEWWHWEYGTPGWALRAGQPAALYGLIEP